MNWTKLLSGRFLFTVCCAVVFLHCSVAGVLSPAEIKEIIMLVIVFYFQKVQNVQKPN